MNERWCAMLNKGNKVGTIVIDPSKALDTLNHDLILYNLKAYGFDTNALNFIQAIFQIDTKEQK